MVAPVNEFDKILQAEASRTLAARGGIILSTTANTVLVDGAGAGTPSIITLKATPMVVAGSVTWSTSPTVPLTLDSTGLIATLHFSDMGTGSVAVTVTLESNGITYTDERTVSQVRIGSLGYAGALDATRNNTAQGPLASRPAGGDGDFYFATDALVLYQKVSGTWQPAGNNFTNTSQMIDGANLGGTATWGGVSGSGKPQDNATVGANASNFTGTLGGDNLMNNSGFEVQTTADTNRPNGYQAYNNAGIAAAYVAVTGRLGGKAYGLKALATGASTFGLASGAYTVETDGTSGGVSGGWQPNTTYIVSFKARKVNGANMTGVALQWNTSPLTTAWVSRPALSTSWQTYTARITLGASVEGNGQLLIDGNGGVGSSVAINDEFHVDELIVQEGDVPSEWFPSPRDAATAIAVITNDNMLSKAEKPQVMIDVAAISDEKPGLVTQCGDLGVDSGPYQTAYNALSAYLASLSPAWNDTTQDTVIDGAAFRTKFTDYYSAKQSLINALASKASTMASGVTLTAGGALQGTGGTGGQVTNLPVIDTRSVNNPPSDYGICHIKEFKDQSVIGIPGASASTFCVLETLKGWNDASGGQALQWAHISSGVVYKRSAANDATSWGAWVRDLDTDIYTGDLDATHGAQAGANLFDASGNVISQTAILNSGVSISAAGALSGAGGGQVTLPGMGHNTYRVITVGNSFSGTLPASVGLYINGVLQSGTNIARSYSVIVFNRSNGNIVSATNYDVYGVGQVGGLTAADMAAALNALATDKIVLVVSYGEPHDHRLDSGLDTAMYRCGASRAVYGSPNFKIRSAYVLVGIPGCGEGNGAEAYQGSIDSDPNAWVDTGFSIVNGVLTGVSVNYRPLTLADFNYTGDLNATYGSTWAAVTGTGKPADYATAGAADAATALGFNPQFSNWLGSYPAGWFAWLGPAPVKETGTVRTAPYAVRYTVSSNTGMYAAINFVTPMPSGSFLQGAYDINVITNNGGGSPGYLVRLFTNSSFTTFVDTIVPVPDKTVTGWQRVPFTARVASGQVIWGLTIYQMAAWTGMPGGLWVDGSICVFDNLTFDFYDSSTDNNVLVPSINSAATTATWSGVSGTGRPADNATVGATLGTNVDGQITSANSSTLVGSQAIQSVHISDLRTTNYAEDSGGNPTAGAKMASTGTALKVASNSFQVGTLVLSDYWFRLLQGVDGNVSTGRIIWRGNNDATTRGGAPDINCLSMYQKTNILHFDSGGPTFAGTADSGSGQHTLYMTFILTPTSYSGNTDNLDAMQQIHVQMFCKTNDTSPFIEFYFACPSRTYDGASGAVKGTWVLGFAFNGSATYNNPPPASSNPNLSGIAPNMVCDFVNGGGGYVYDGFLRVRMANTYGWSATKDFGPPGTHIPGGSPSYNLSNLCPSTTITGVAGSSGGGSGSQGGACPAPWVKVRLLSGRDVSASDLHNGAVLAAVNDSTMEALPKGGIVRDLATIWAQRYRVKLTDGSVTEWSENHRFSTVGRGWVAVQNLRSGDQIMGLRECVVDSVLAVGEGQVVSFRVDGAGTYFAGGMLCHNTKTTYL